MSSIKIDNNKCSLCEKCIEACPFGAIQITDSKITINSSCKMCKLCVKSCPESAISVSEKKNEIDKSKWQGILVYAQFFDGAVHPVTYELIGKAQQLAKKVGMKVYCLIIGHNLQNSATDLLSYGVDKVFTYDDEGLNHFKVDSYTNAFSDLIQYLKPSVVLVGGTSIGRSLAPRVASRFRTGLTADCTTLDIKENSDLIQIRPAFGGNIMAQIVTPFTRPQFATVRYKVMDIAQKTSPHGEIIRREVTKEMLSSNIEVINITQKEKEVSISESEVLVVAGDGLKSKDDIQILEKLAHLLGGQLAATRPVIEKGWCDYTRQIGLSGRTVKPKLIITCAVSGAIQFTSCMNASDCIVAINTDENAPIFKIAHYGLIGDVYSVIPQLIAKIEGGAL